MIVTVYSKPNCTQCNATYRFLDQKQIAYEVVDITEHPEAIDLISSWGFYNAPVVVAGEEKWSGFRPDMIEKIVKTVKANA